jgi:nucleotide-binding universal stress UspA family protein
MTTFLIATDGSTTADAAVDTAVKLAEEENADVVFLHVVDEIDVHVLSLTEPGSIPRALDHPNLSEPLQHAASVARELGVAYELRLASGYDVDVILETADAIHAEVIAVGSNRHGLIGTTLRGSVARELLKRARRPVLVVHPAREWAETLASCGV